MKRRLLSLIMALSLLLTACGAQDIPSETEESTAVPEASTAQVEDADTDTAAPETAPTTYEELFAGDRVIDVQVTISDEDWASILESPLDKDYKSVSVVVDGIALENVGFSTKGNSTLRAVAGSEETDRYSFRLKFDKFESGQTLLGLDKLSMNNNMSDASYLREYLHYEALGETALPTPLTTFVNLYINGELYGLYTGVENVEKAFLERHFGEGYQEGVLYDTDERATLQYEESGEYKALVYDRGVEDDKASLQHFIRTLGEMPQGEKGDIESVLDVDSALIYIAANTVFGNYDSYNGAMSHNYKLYGDADGKFTILPWDYNMSFGGFSGGPGGGGRGGDSTDVITVSIDEPVSGTTMENAPLISNLLAVPEYKERYVDYIRGFMAYLERVEQRANTLADLIRPHVEADPTKFYTMEAFESNLVYNEGESGGQGAAMPGGMTMPELAGDPPAMPEGPGGGEPPEGMPEGMEPPDWQDMPFGEGGPSGGERPSGFPGGGDGFPGGGDGFPGGGDGFGGGRGGGIMGSSGSLVTFAANRLENLKEQLSGYSETAAQE